MPTGFTDGILKGTTKTFPQFATTCMRAFMPLIHMREDSFEAKYKPRKPSPYHIKELKKAKSNLKKWQSYSDKKILDLERKDIKSTIDYYEKKIKEIRKNKKSLDEMLARVINWLPPTDDHANFKKFMIEQLETTIRMDADVEYSVKELEKNKLELENLNPVEVREKGIKKFKWDIEYNTEQLTKDIKNCKSSHKWVNDLIKSLK